jgi:hypothetical protein
MSPILDTLTGPGEKTSDRPYGVWFGLIPSWAKDDTISLNSSRDYVVNRLMKAPLLVPGKVPQLLCVQIEPWEGGCAECSWQRCFEFPFRVVSSGCWMSKIQVLKLKMISKWLHPD